MYTIYLNEVLFPIAPEKIQTKYGNQNKTVTLLSEGEASILKLPSLTELEFDLRLPQQEYPFAVYEDGFRDAGQYLELLTELKSQKKPFYCKLLRMRPDGFRLYDTELYVSLEEYSIKEDVSDGMDVTVSVKLKQYRPFQTKRLPLLGESGTVQVTGTKQKREPKAPAKSYTVKKGDSLWKICKKELGDGSKCWEVARKNNIKNPNLIYPGQIITFS